MKRCSWCKKEMPTHRGVTTLDFTLEFVSGTYSDIFGPSGSGYKVEAMCEECGVKLGDELKKLGVELTEIDY